jgi:phosphatidylglycerol:prolipoprotein diacylglycerol transferase
MLPVLFSDTFPIYTYPLLMGLAWGLSYYWSRQIFEKLGLDPIKFRAFYWGLFISSWIGAKLLFVITTKNYDKFDLIRSQYFWAGGGFVFYGGLIGGSLFSLLAIKYKIVTQELISLLIPVIALGHGIGRIGCYLVGCCYGSQCITGLCLHSKIPVQLVEAAFLFAFMFFTFTKFWKAIEPIKKITFYLLSYSNFRFNIEFLRGDISRGIYGNFSTSQYVSLIIIMICLTTYFLSLREQRR